MNVEGQNIDDELMRLRALAWRMDALFYIPRTNISVGLDNLLGFIPVVGDVATAAPSIWMIWKARQLGATPGAVAYMVANLMTDMLIGTVPLAGDIFDIAYNANIRNYRLLEKNLNRRAEGAATFEEPEPRRLGWPGERKGPPEITGGP